MVHVPLSPAHFFNGCFTVYEGLSQLYISKQVFTLLISLDLWGTGKVDFKTFILALKEMPPLEDLWLAHWLRASKRWSGAKTHVFSKVEVKVLGTQSCPTLCDSMDCKPARLLCPWNSPGKNTSPEDLPDPGIKPGSPTLQADSLLSEQPGKPICL